MTKSKLETIHSRHDRVYEKTILDEELEKCRAIHDVVAEHWNWAYYSDTSSDDSIPSSWLTREYAKRLKRDVKPRTQITLQEVEELVKQHSHETFSILDVGCGVGGFFHEAIQLLTENYPNIKFKPSGIDISKEMIKYASRNLRDLKVELICDSITNPSLKFKNEPFDVAILMVTLSFYGDDNARMILRSIREKLKNSGWLVIMDFGSTFRWRGLALFSKPLEKLTDMMFSSMIGESVHFHRRKSDKLEILINDSGYEVTKSYLSEKKSEMKGMQVIVARPNQTVF